MPAPHADPLETAADEGGLPLSARSRDVLTVAWPSFLMAGVLEALVFSVVDPGSLHWFGGAPIDWSPQAVYTVSFFIFWTVIALAGGLTRLLNREFDPRR